MIPGVNDPNLKSTKTAKGFTKETRRKLLSTVGARACDLCRKRKARCDSSENPGKPCSLCVRVGGECTYLDKYSRRGPTLSYVENLEKRVERVQALLEKYATKEEIASNLRSGVNTAEEKGHGGPWFADLGQPDSKATMHAIIPGIAESLTRSKKETVKQEVLDELEISWEDLPEEMERLTVGGGYSHRVYGKSSGNVFLQDARQMKEMQLGPGVSNMEKSTMDWAVSPLMWEPIKWLQDAWRDDMQWKPLGAPFPPDDLVRSLFGLYFRHVAPFFPVLNRRAFLADYDLGQHRSCRRQEAIVLLVCAIGSVYSDDPRLASTTGNTPSDGWRYFLRKMDWMHSFIPSTLRDLQIYALTGYYLEILSHPHSAWTVVGVGIRMALDAGIHRDIACKDPKEEADQWKYVFYCLVLMDRTMSAALGRSTAFHDEESDLILPEEAPGVDENRPIEYLRQFLKLACLYSTALRSIYAIRKPDVMKCIGSRWELWVVKALTEAAQHWHAALPDHLKWDPNRENVVHFEQSACLNAAYHCFLVLLHRPFIFPALPEAADECRGFAETCVASALACSEIIACQARRTPTVLVQARSAAVGSAVILLAQLWTASPDDPTIDRKAMMDGVQKCLFVLRDAQRRWYHAGVYADIIADLARCGPKSGDRIKPVVSASNPSNPSPFAKGQSTRERELQPLTPLIFGTSAETTQHTFDFHSPRAEFGELPMGASYQSTYGFDGEVRLPSRGSSPMAWSWLHPDLQSTSSTFGAEQLPVPPPTEEDPFGAWSILINAAAFRAEDI